MNWNKIAWDRWPEAEWIDGNGQYALLAHCGDLTITLWPTMQEAEKSKRSIDETGCGHDCYEDGYDHEIITLDAKQKAHSFGYWLKRQIRRDDPVGDVARDYNARSGENIKCCTRFRTSYNIFQHIKTEHTPCNSALEALREAHREYLSANV